MGGILNLVEKNMEPEIQTFGEAIVAAAHERISKKINGRSWLEIVAEWNETDDSILAGQLQAVISELAREAIHFLGDKVVGNVELPLH